MRLYAITIFVSAFLLFQVQPLISKAILPWFGGSAAVWTVCLLFFQVVLLLGYLYSHCSIRYLKPGQQKWLHIGLLAISLISLPVLPRESLKPLGSEDPTQKILFLLLLTVGLPYFLLSTTGPLLQAWFAYGGVAGSQPAEGAGKPASTAFPYRLYALSNIGSMLALLSYPVAVEPFLTNHQQAYAWSAGYVCFVVLCSLVAWRVPARVEVRQAETAGESSASEAAAEEQTLARPKWYDYLLWVFLSASACALLLAITTHLTQNIASIPFLWILPLSLYLLTFIICFGGKTWRTPILVAAMTLLSILAMTYSLVKYEILGVTILIPLFAGGLFFCCLLCHGELASRKPSPRYLTAFYLMISLGGAIGGIFVGVIAPHQFRGFYELPLSIAACALLTVVILGRELNRSKSGQALNQWLTVSIFPLVSTFLLLPILFYLVKSQKQPEGTHVIVRSFYGLLRTTDWPAEAPTVRSLTNGTIRHGVQYLSGEHRLEPTSYYAQDSGIGLAIASREENADKRVGVIGLGTGTLAVYGEEGDTYRFYDINPQVPRIAQTEFTYLRDSGAKIEIVLGDARLSLEREPPQDFDVLAIDAFSSDSIPVHLLTKQAFELYFRHLKPDGILAVHISNRYLRLGPVVAQLAHELGKEARLVHNTPDEDNDNLISPSEWVLVTTNRSLFDKPDLKEAAQVIPLQPGLRTWTDDYSNLFQILRTDDDSNFLPFFPKRN